MKILFFIESLRSGGKERRLVELIKGLQNYPSIECELVLTRKEIHYKDIFTTGINIHYTIRKRLKKDPRVFYKFYKIAKDFRPDIIHVWGNMVAIYAIPAKIFLKIPMINNQITSAPLHVKGGLLSYKLTFPFSNLIIANSYAGLKSYNAPKAKSSVIYNGFDFNRIANLIDKNTIREKFNIKTKNVVGMVASFSDFKDYETYVRAANKILEKRNDVTFLCVGAGDDNYYRKLVNPEHKENIKFLGKQGNVESIMNICDIGVLSTYTEGVSNSIMEFMALGKPVIATDGGGTKEIVIEDITGNLIPVSDTNKLFKLIIQLLNNQEKRLFLGVNAQQKVINEFNIEMMIKKYMKVYLKFKNN